MTKPVIQNFSLFFTKLFHMTLKEEYFLQNFWRHFFYYIYSAKVLQIALFNQVNTFHTSAETSWGLSIVKDDYQVSNHSSHSGTSSSNSQRAGYHTYPSQYHISICSRHDKPTSLYLQLVLLDPSFFLKEWVVISWLLFTTAKVKIPSNNLSEHSNHHAFMLSWITFLYKNMALTIVVT
jgi:hypothetical protein